jgi:uncharacterized protein YybS (DUF2232 family)
MENDARSLLLDVLKGGAATAAIFIVFLYLPPAVIAAGFLAPFPALFYGLKRRWPVAAAVVALATGIIAAAGGVGGALTYLLQAGTLSIALAVLLARGMNASRSVGIAVLATLAVIVLFAAGYGMVQGVDLHAQIVGGIRSSIAQTVSLYQKRGIPVEELQLITEGLEQGGEVMARIYPALMVIGVGMVAGVNLLLARRVANRLSTRLQVEPFSHYRNPDLLVWVLIAAGFSLLIDQAVLSLVAVNLLVIAAVLYFFQGLAVIVHFFTIYEVPRFFRIVFYVLLVVQAYLVLAVAVLGLSDLWGNFRRPRQPLNL